MKTALLRTLLPALLLISVRCYLFNDGRLVPKEGHFGIYTIDLATGDIGLIWAVEDRLDKLALDPAGQRLAFSRRIGCDDLEHEELCTIGIDGTGYARLTDNDILDTYPAWSPDGSRLMYLSWPDSTLDIWLMQADGDNARLLYDSGSHDADISWVENEVAFTTGSRAWMMNDDGTGARQVTDPPRAGEWGNAVLPFGDYDPRLSPDATRIVFERMVDDQTTHGNYDIFLINPDGTGETRLTETGWTQGIANWSPDGQELIFLVSAVGTEGRYDIWLMDADGTNRRDVMPGYVPSDFLCHNPLFGPYDDIVFFIGEWWE